MKTFKMTVLAGLLLWTFSPISHAGGTPTPVSMVGLIANSSKYDGNLIRTTGYLVYSPQGDQGQAYLYFDKDHAQASDSSSALSLRLPSSILQFVEEYEDEYVDVTGSYDERDRGPGGLYGGSLKGVTSLKLRVSAADSFKYSLHAYALPITEVESATADYSQAKKLVFDWLSAVQKMDYAELARTFGMSEKQMDELKNGSMPRAHWLLFDAKSSIYSRFEGQSQLVFRLYQHSEDGYGRSLYGCLFSPAMSSPALSYTLTNQLPGLYGHSNSICLDILDSGTNFSVSFLPFESPDMR